MFKIHRLNLDSFLKSFCLGEVEAVGTKIASSLMQIIFLEPGVIKPKHGSLMIRDSSGKLFIIYSQINVHQICEKYPGGIVFHSCSGLK